MPALAQGQQCPLCAGPATHAFTARDLNRAVSREPFDYWRCAVCETFFLSPVPGDLGRYYPEDYYTPPSRQGLEEAAHGERFKLDLLADHTPPGGRLVEVGPGTGAFARAALQAGFEVTAIEMDEHAGEYLRDVVGAESIISDAPQDVLPTLPPSRAIAMWHVIEHLPEPWEVLERAAENLEPGGVLAIAAPNPEALQFRLLRSRWAHLDAPRHLFLIPRRALDGRCRELGLRPAFTTTADPQGRYWNWFGWDYALRPSPRSRTPRLHSALPSLALARLMRPIETRGGNGCAYTSVFVKDRPR